MSLRNRISVAAAAGVFVVVAIVSSVLYAFYAASLGANVDASLIDAAQQATAVLQRVKQTSSDKGSTPDLDKPVTVGSIELQLLPAPVEAGRPTRFGPLDSHDVAVSHQAAPSYFTDAFDGGVPYRVYTTAMPGSAGAGLVRTSRAGYADAGALAAAGLLLAALTLLSTLATYAAARLMAGRILSPIARLTAATEHVAATGDLTARIEPNGTDEVGRLGRSFDVMLAALHDSVTAQHQLIADASHELRTPLTSLTTNLELLEDGAGLADSQAPGLVRAAREEAEELNRLITDLLDLARYGESAVNRQHVRLDLLTEEILERFRIRVPDGALHAALEPSLVLVDAAAVGHAISNLIENAIKWSPAGAQVSVTVRDARVTVVDHGPGIADSDLPHIFERFYRADTARARPGSGLGLAIVGRVAELNDGTVSVSTGPEGSAFAIAFSPADGAVDVETTSGVGDVERRDIERLEEPR